MRKNKQKNSKNISAIVNNLLIFQKYCDKINKSKGYGGYHMLNSLNNVVNFLNSYIWGVGMLILIVGVGYILQSDYTVSSLYILRICGAESSISRILIREFQHLVHFVRPWQCVSVQVT